MALGRKPIEIVNEGANQLLSKAKHWERIYLHEVAKVQNGFAFSSTNFSKTEGTPLIRIRDIDNETTVDRYIGDFQEEYLVNKGDILVGMDGDFKAAKWKGEQALLNQRVCRIFLNSKEFDEKFLFLCLQPFLDAIHAETSAVTVKHLSSRTIEEIPLPLPPLGEQKRIVSKLEELYTELDKGIEELKTAQLQLKVYRQAVLKWAFEGKLTNAHVKDGELPEGWNKGTIGDIFEVFIGSTPSRKNANYWNGTVNWVSSGEVAFKNITKTREKISQEGLENSSCKVHPPGTVIMAMIGEGKTRGQAAILKVPAAHNQNTAAIRVPAEHKSELLYYFLVLKYEENRKIGSGNNQKALNKERVKSISFPIIPFEV